MYEVIKMYGDFEPWWFIDGWEEDIVERQSFQTYEEAFAVFQKEWERFSERFPHERSQDGNMVAFWDEADQYWCQECDEDLQRYHSLLLMKYQAYEESTGFSTGLPRVRPCALKRDTKKKITG